MSNHDLTIANGPGINVRQDIEAALQALGTTFYGTVGPLIPYPCQIWADASTGLLRMRNSANSAWITLGSLDTANFGHLPIAGGTITGNLTVQGTTTTGPLNSGAHGVTGALNVSANANFGTTVLSGSGFYVDTPGGSARGLYGRTSGSLRWAISLGTATAEGGSNTGSDFTINRYSDGGGYLDSPITITRSTGGITLANPTVIQGTLNVQGNVAIAGVLSVAANTASLTAPNGSFAYWHSIVTGARDWVFGTDGGGNYLVYDVSGAATRLQITPAGIVNITGIVNISNSLTVGTALTATGLITDGPNAVAKTVVWTQNGSTRWLMQSTGTAESGTNVGSDFAFHSYTNAGAVIGPVLTIVRATRVVTFSQPIVNGSDRRLKSGIEPVAGALAIVEQLEGVYYFDEGDEGGRRHVGLVAQDVMGALPEVVFEVSDDPEKSTRLNDSEAGPLLGLAYPNIVAVLINAVKELSAKVATLEGVRR